MRVYRWERWGVHTPVTIERVRKQLKREGLASRRRAQHEEKHRGKEKRQQGCRVPNAGLPIYYNNREGRTSQGKVICVFAGRGPSRRPFLPSVEGAAKEGTLKENFKDSAGEALALVVALVRDLRLALEALIQAFLRRNPGLRAPDILRSMRRRIR